MAEWRITADHPDSRRPVTLYITPYEGLAQQEWDNTPRTETAFTGHRLQRRDPGGEWEDVPDGQ